MGSCCCYMEWPGGWRAVSGLLWLALCPHFSPQLLLWAPAHSHQAGESQRICLTRAAPPPSLPASAAREFETHIKGNKREIIEVELEKSPKEVIVPDGSQFFPSVNYSCLSLCIDSLSPWSEKDKISHPDFSESLLLCISRPQSFQVLYKDGCKQLLKDWGIKSLFKFP